jgi:predicted nucleic acid-binding protein
MDYLVVDANVLIDFEVGELIRRLFELPEQHIIPDILFDDEMREEHSYLLKLGLKPISLTPDSMMLLASRRNAYRRVSVYDLSATLLARQESCPLLTGDKNLREVTELEDVECRGSLWLARRLHAEALVTATDLRSAFDRMRNEGRRLPWHQVDSLIDDLKHEESDQHGRR